MTKQTRIFGIITLLAIGLLALNNDADARGGSRARIGWIDPCAVSLCMTPDVKVAIAKDKGVAEAHKRYVKAELACKIAKANTYCSRTYFSNEEQNDPFWYAERVALDKLRFELGRYALEVTKQ